MDEYISREEFISTMKARLNTSSAADFLCTIIVQAIKAFPAADVVPVVRCRECENWDEGVPCGDDIGLCQEYDHFKHKDGWCNCGRRREGEERCRASTQ